MRSLLLLFIVSSASFLFSCEEDQDAGLKVIDQTFSIAENSPVGTVVGSVQTNSSSELTFTIVSGNTFDSFKIEEATGLITVESSSALDFERDPSFLLVVSVSDALETQTGVIKIKLVDINEPPEELVFDSVAYVIKDGLLVDLGAVQVVDQQGETHYQYDFALLNDNLTVRVEGDKISYEADNPTFILHSPLFSPGASSFRGTIFQYLNTEGLSKSEVEGNAFFKGVRLVVIDGDEKTTFVSRIGTINVVQNVNFNFTITYELGMQELDEVTNQLSGKIKRLSYTYKGDFNYQDERPDNDRPDN